MELNPNLNYYSVDLEENDRHGLCRGRRRAAAASAWRFRQRQSENRLARYDRVRLDLNGCRLTRTAAPDCMTLTGVQALNVLSVAPGHGRGSSREGAERRDSSPTTTSIPS